jgi:hypothetical protein
LRERDELLVGEVSSSRVGPVERDVERGREFDTLELLRNPLGVVSSSLAGGALCPWVKAGLGASPQGGRYVDVAPAPTGDVRERLQ